MTVTRLYNANNPDDVLEQAMGIYQSVVIIGWAKDDEALECRASTNMSEADMIYVIEAAKHGMLSGEFEDE